MNFLNNHTAITMTGVMSCCSLTSFSVLTIGSRIIRYRASIELVEEETADMISAT
jgi:hypothetical protein